MEGNRAMDPALKDQIEAAIEDARLAIAEAKDLIARREASGRGDAQAR
jgi:hypothetical protein